MSKLVAYVLRAFGYASIVGSAEERAPTFGIMESSSTPKDLKHAPYHIEKLATNASQTGFDTREKTRFDCASHNGMLYGARLAEEHTGLTAWQIQSPVPIYAAGALYDEQSSCLEQDDHRLYEMRVGWNNGIEPLIRQLEINRNIRAW